MCGGADDPPADVSGTDGLCSRDRPPFGRPKTPGAVNKCVIDATH
jgi:hypothetical protein